MANPKEDLRARLLVTFQAEAEEHLQTIAHNLGALDRGLPPEEVPAAVEATFRALHTLKGAARSVGLDHLESLCQSLESLLSRVKKGQLRLGPELLASLQGSMDDLGRLLAGGPAPAPAIAVAPTEPPQTAPPLRARKAPAGPSSAGAATIRVDTARLDALHTRAEDLLAAKLAVIERAREAQAMVETLDRCRAQAERSGAVQPLVRQAEGQARRLLRTLVAHQRSLGASVDGLQEEARRLRMMPASAVLDAFPRMVGEMARAQGKEVDWSAHGAELELDRKVLETVKEALIHLVRNAVDHGIERPEERERQGRPRRGRVAVTFAPLEGRRVEVRVEDDGAGIDPAGIRAAAVRARLRSPEEAEALPDEAALNLIFSSGLSTSPVITDLSGHGLGMAIVRDRVERLGGRVFLETRRGAGTTVRMVLPASVATFRGLLVRAGRQPFLLPLDALERALRLAPNQVESAGGREAIRWEGRAIPFARLARVLGRTQAEGNDGPRPCLIVASGGERAALLVDEILGEHEVLVKELRPPLVRVRHVAGAGLLGSGELALILRPADLSRAAREATSASPGATPAKAAEESRPSAVLVVDDSITTRTMEKNLLEAAGYKVQVAADGIEAWSALKTERFDLVVSDVDMPRLNGFDLTSRIRADPDLADLPVVLVTALESREDKERGIEVGANAYVIKSGFDQSKLLDIVGRLV
jgi:two-component system chemotaxis sensor kinase CheA